MPHSDGDIYTPHVSILSLRGDALIDFWPSEGAVIDDARGKACVHARMPDRTRAWVRACVRACVRVCFPCLRGDVLIDLWPSERAVIDDAPGRCTIPTIEVTFRV